MGLYKSQYLRPNVESRQIVEDVAQGHCQA